MNYILAITTITSKFKYYLWFFILILCNISCVENEEGCLDIAASNFDASADSPCESCCNYPELSFEIVHTFGDTSFQLGTLYPLPDTQVFRATDIRFYISNVRLENELNSVSIEDTINLHLRNGEILVRKDDFTKVIRNAGFKITLGEFRAVGTYNTLRFTVGLDESANLTDPSTISGDHVLSVQSDSMFINDEEGYVFSRFGIVTDTTTNDTVNFETTNLEGSREVTLNLTLNVDLGFNASIPLKIDYKEWLKGINFATDSDEEIRSAIVNNITNAFFIDD